MSDQKPEMFPDILAQTERERQELAHEQSLADQRRKSLLDAIQRATNDAARTIDARVQEVLTAYAASYNIVGHLTVSQDEQQWRWEITQTVFPFQDDMFAFNFSAQVIAQLNAATWNTVFREFFLVVKPTQHHRVGYQPLHDLRLAVRLHEATNWPVIYESPVDSSANYKRLTDAFPQAKKDHALGDTRLNFRIGWPEKKSIWRRLFQRLRPNP